MTAGEAQGVRTSDRGCGVLDYAGGVLVAEIPVIDRPKEKHAIVDCNVPPPPSWC